MVEARDLSTPSIVFLKVETSGFYRHDLSMDDQGQPFAMEIGALLCNASGAITSQFASVIRPEGRRPQENAFRVHGISDRAAAQVGVPEPRILGLLADLLKTPVVSGLKVVTYTNFDPMIISSLFARFAVSQGKGSSVYDGLWFRRPLIEFITLQSPWCQQACKLPDETDSGEYRRPTLDEAAEIVLGTPARAALHDALSGLHRVKDIYFHFLNSGMLEKDAA